MVLPRSVSKLGEEITRSNNNTIEKLRTTSVYFSSQYINLYPTMSLQENIEYFSGGKLKQEDTVFEREYLLQYLKLDDIKNNLVESYSQGERKRASILLGLLLSPKLLLIDEPIAYLDELNQVKVISLLADYVMSTQSSVVLVSHDLLTILPNSRVLEIKNNKIVNDIIATKDYCEDLKEQFLSKKSIEIQG
ncbi:MAG: ATP-binding cassette domain-containing protein [Asgard group archaeon]|nr:ATP-binding cassette domain-containing protein [Asgard group archaeon]